MSTARSIPPHVLDVQIAASDPGVSAWVSANAGSGKTHVLAQRVIRLLLDGVDPAKILCITFTKAAAATMANRVFDTLAAWATLDDAALDVAIAKVGARRPDAARRARARRLFATALETPGGLKVQTIHAFCTRLLHQFPFEANVAARFTVLDGSAEAQLLDQLMLAVLLDGAQAPDSALGRALARAVGVAADQTFKDVVKDAIRERQALSAWFARAGTVEAAMAELSQALGLAPGDAAESVEAEFFAASPFAAADWPKIADLLSTGSKTDNDQADRFARLATVAARERLGLYLSIFCTGKLEPRKNIVTKTIATDYPGLTARLVREQERVCALLDRRNAVVCRDRTAALLTIAAAVLDCYRAEKDRRGLLDYEDLIEKTLALFDGVTAAWVLYKLDLGIDHVLIDEAQDTSPQQWAIIDHVVSEFTAGAGARGALKRTLFAVGDDKQSIFSFQGAAPHKFDEMRRSYGRRFTAAGLDWVEKKFESSFRSGGSVLGAVDTVFARQEVYAALSLDSVQTVHQALPDAAPGLVEIWPLFKAEKTPEVEGWAAPFDTVSEVSSQVKLARKIAATVAVWRKQGRRPGDVLVLVRQRGALFEAIIRALKAADIAVAGADRLVLTEHIAVMDLMVLADALLLPQDDLALATVLRSPLFGFTDEQLFALAHGRSGSLRQSLAEKTAADPAFAAAAARLGRLAGLARRETPFSFYAHLLGAEGGRERFLARLGHEAADALDEFLNLALDYESRETPSLQGFVAWLRSAQTEVKRDMELARDEVRVMTVHGAKGLEAPIVVLADTTTKPAGPRDPRLLMLPADGAPPGTPDRLVWAGSKAGDVGPVRAARERARQAAQDEYCRLLYVAMTRAAERLIVAGTEGVHARPQGCWYDLVSDALTDLAVTEPADDGDGAVLRFRKGKAVAEPSGAAEEPAKPVAMGLPDWLKRDARPEEPRVTIAPSAAFAPPPLAREVGVPGAASERALALARGRLVHRLLQALPDIALDRRAEAVRQYLARAEKEFAEAEREAIAEQVLALLSSPRFAPLFAPGSRGEVPIVGRIVRPGRTPLGVSGQVDRLAVTGEAVLIADFKTDRAPPRITGDVPDTYVAQLALYRAVLARLYPGREVRAALVWTEIPDLMEISAPALDRAVAALTSV